MMPEMGVKRIPYFIQRKSDECLMSNYWLEILFPTRSCAALRVHGVKTDFRVTGWESDHFSLPTRGHNWRFWCLDKNLDVYSH